MELWLIVLVTLLWRDITTKKTLINKRKQNLIGDLHSFRGLVHHGGEDDTGVAEIYIPILKQRKTLGPGLWNLKTHPQDHTSSNKFTPSSIKPHLLILLRCHSQVTNEFECIEAIFIQTTNDLNPFS